MSAENLPPGWQTVHLGSLAKGYLSGGTPSSKEIGFWGGLIPWTTSAPITESDVVLSQAQRFITPEGLQDSSTNLVPKGNLLVGTRVGVGKAVMNTVDIAISQDLTGVVLDHSLIDAEFMAYQMKTARIQSFLIGRSRGTTIKGVSRFDLQSVEISLPPLPEQRAIARALRAVQEAKEARRREIAVERERKAALMQHLFTHGATAADSPQVETMYGSVPCHWKIQLLEDVAYVQTGVAKGRRLDGNRVVAMPYLRVANVQDGFLDLSEIKHIELQESEVDRYRLQRGDVLLTEGGDFDKLGRGFIWSGEIPDCIHQNHVFAVRARLQRMLPEFLSYMVQSHYGKAYFLNVAHRTTNLACINSAKLKRFPALVPSLEEQRSIADVLGASDAKIAALEREAGLLDELFRGMLEELMSGRLSAAGNSPPPPLPTREGSRKGAVVAVRRGRSERFE